MIEIVQEVKSVNIVAEQDGISVELQPVLLRDSGIDISGLVPYTGATSHVDLGSKIIYLYQDVVESKASIAGSGIDFYPGIPNITDYASILSYKNSTKAFAGGIHVWGSIVNDVVQGIGISGESVYDDSDFAFYVEKGTKDVSIPGYNIDRAVGTPTFNLGLDNNGKIIKGNLASSGASPILTAYKTADESKVSDNTQVLDTDLQMELEANSVYNIQASWIVSGDSTSDFRWLFEVPTGASGNYADGVQTSAGSAGIITFATAKTIQTTSSIKYGSIVGIITTTDAGTFGLKWSQGNLNVASTTLYKGSNIILTKLA